MVPVLAAVLAAVRRKLLPGGKAIRFGLAIALFVCTAAYYGSFVVHGVPIFPSHMPLELCDASLWLVLAALLTLNPAIFDVAYYWALAGTSMALLTPNLTEPTPFQEVQFFANHGLIVVSTLYLVWSGQARPRPGSAGRAMLALNIFAAAVGGFDFLFKTDYMFLCPKPPAVSLLDVMGPWPLVHRGLRRHRVRIIPASGPSVLALSIECPGVNGNSQPSQAQLAARQSPIRSMRLRQCNFRGRDMRFALG